MALTKLMGQNFRIQDGSSVINEAVTCSVQIQGNQESVNTKDDAGGFVKEQMTSRNWNVSVETLDVSVATLRKYIQLFVNQGGVDTSGSTGITVGWDQTSGTDNKTLENAEIARSGNAFLTSIGISAANRQTCRLSLGFQGNGPIQ